VHLRRELGAALGLAESVGEPLIKANGLNGATDLRSVPSPDRVSTDEFKCFQNVLDGAGSIHGAGHAPVACYPRCRRRNAECRGKGVQTSAHRRAPDAELPCGCEVTSFS
jgi:hypothetical protein